MLFSNRKTINTLLLLPYSAFYRFCESSVRKTHELAFHNKVAKFCVLRYGEPFAVLVCLVGRRYEHTEHSERRPPLRGAAAWPTVTSLNTPMGTRRHETLFAILSTNGIN